MGAKNPLKALPCAALILFCIARTEWSEGELWNEFRFVWFIGAALFFGHAALILMGQRWVQLFLAFGTVVYSLLLAELGRLGATEIFLCPAVFILVAVGSIFMTPIRPVEPQTDRKLKKTVVIVALAAAWILITLGAFGAAYALADRRIISASLMDLIPFVGLAGLIVSVWIFLRRANTRG